MIKLKDILEGKYTVHFDVGSPGLMSNTVDAKNEKEAAKKVAAKISGKIKIKKVVKESVSQGVLKNSAPGGSKQFLKDFDRVFKKKSKELGYGKLDKKVQVVNVQVSKPAGLDKAIKYEKRKGVEVDYQFDEGVIPGRGSNKYSLDDFKKDLKKFSGYKIKQDLPVMFTLTKGDYQYSLAYIGAMNGVFVKGDARI